MRTAALLLASVVPAAAAGQAPPDGYSCDEEAFRALLSFTGKVSIKADAAYRPTRAEFTWQVSDQRVGRGRMTATWALAGKKIAGTPPHVFIPLWRERSALPVTVTATLDGQPLGVRRYEARGERVAVFDGEERQVADQQQVAVFSDDRDRWIPELFGHSLLTYRVTDARGIAVGGDDLLLPRRDKVESQIGSAVERAESNRKHKRCSPFYILRGV